jgi:hypothetical protein
MKKWDIYEQYLIQGEEGTKTLQKYGELVSGAEKKVNDLKVKLDEAFSIEVTSGVDKSSEKAKLRSAIESAEKEVAAKIEERSKAHEIISKQGQSINSANLVIDYRDNYRLSVIADEVTPLIQKVEEARSLYFNALFDLFDKEDEYNPVYRQAKEFATTTPINGVYQHVSNPVDFSRIKTITAHEINGADFNRVLPNDIKRTKGDK